MPTSGRKTEYAGYLFAYFTGEGTADGEQIRYALSRGNDALHWRELNAGQPVLTSTIGEKGLRDPFVIRSPEGDKFYMIATDLRMYRNSSGSWDQSRDTAASRSWSGSPRTWCTGPTSAW